jgi:hypothetical protein
VSKRPLLIAALASLTAAALLAIAILLFGDFGSTEGRILATTLAVSFYSLLTLPGSILVERRSAVALGWTTIVLGVLSFLLAAAAIWGLVGEEPGWKLTGIATAWAAATTQIAALTSRRRSADDTAVRSVVIGACTLAVVLAVLVTVAIAAELEDAERFFRVLAALAVLNVFLLAFQPILRRLRSPDAGLVRVVLEGTPDQIAEALRRVEGSGVDIRGRS